MTANFSTIRAALAAILRADTDLNDAGQVFEYDPEISTISVDPWAVVIASGNLSEFETKRTFKFIVKVYADRSSAPDTAETLLTGIVDRMLDALDADITLGVNGVIFTLAAPSAWSYVLAEKTYRVAEINISAVASIDVS